MLESSEEGENRLGQQARICDSGTLILGSVDKQDLGRRLRSAQLGSGSYVGLASRTDVYKMLNPRWLGIQWDCQQKWIGTKHRKEICIWFRYPYCLHRLIISFNTNDPRGWVVVKKKYSVIQMKMFRALLDICWTRGAWLTKTTACLSQACLPCTLECRPPVQMTTVLSVAPEACLLPENKWLGFAMIILPVKTCHHLPTGPLQECTDDRVQNRFTKPSERILIRLRSLWCPWCGWAAGNRTVGPAERSSK